MLHLFLNFGYSMLLSHMMNLKRVWTDSYRVNWSDADAAGRLSLPGLFGAMQESAWHHANHIGFGFESLSDSRHVWVLVRLLVKMDRFPVWEEPYQITTWPSGSEGFTAFREFLIQDNEGATIGLGTSSWMILDMESRRPRKDERLKEFDTWVATEKTLGGEAPRINAPVNPESFGIHTVRASDVDQHGHVNNANYVRMAMDVFQVQQFREAEPVGFCINYLAEAFEGDEIELLRSGLPEYPVMKIAGRRVADQKLIFACEVTWRSV